MASNVKTCVLGVIAVMLITLVGCQEAPKPTAPTAKATATTQKTPKSEKEALEELRKAEAKKALEEAEAEVEREKNKLQEHRLAEARGEKELGGKPIEDVIKEDENKLNRAQEQLKKVKGVVEKSTEEGAKKLAHPSVLKPKKSPSPKPVRPPARSRKPAPERTSSPSMHQHQPPEKKFYNPALEQFKIQRNRELDFAIVWWQDKLEALRFEKNHLQNLEEKFFQAGETAQRLDTTVKKLRKPLDREERVKLINEIIEEFDLKENDLAMRQLRIDTELLYLQAEIQRSEKELQETYKKERSSKIIYPPRWSEIQKIGQLKRKECILQKELDEMGFGRPDRTSALLQFIPRRLGECEDEIKRAEENIRYLEARKIR